MHIGTNYKNISVQIIKILTLLLFLSGLLNSSCGSGVGSEKAVRSSTDDSREGSNSKNQHWQSEGDDYRSSSESTSETRQNEFKSQIKNNGKKKSSQETFDTSSSLKSKTSDDSNENKPLDTENFRSNEFKKSFDQMDEGNRNPSMPLNKLKDTNDDTPSKDEKKSLESFVTKIEHEDTIDPFETNTEKEIQSNEQEKLHGDASPLSPPSKEMSDEERAILQKREKSLALYHEAMKLINSSTTRSSVAKGYQMLREASNMGNSDAEVELGFAHMMGSYLPLHIAQAREIFEKHAASGNPRAQAGLGVMYATGIGTNSSQAKALVYLTFSALGNDVMGRMILGYRYLSGIGVAKSCETALNYYRTVADQVAANAKVNGGSILMRVRLLDEVDRPGSNYGVVDDDLVQYYQFLADKGDIPAQVTLGQLNYQGSQGFEQNHAKAFEYFTKAAEAGNANALGYLGKIYSEGTETVKQSNTTAIKYFKQAAEKGNPIGHAGLGLMYLYGKGVDIDHEKAFKHFQSSADQGWPEGQLHLGNMYFNGLGVKRDFKQALRCFNLAAQNGHLLALYYLAQMHSSGNGVPRNCQTATELYKNVCERGRWSSLFELAYKHYKAERKDSSLAIYMVLAELGYEVAQSNAAFILDQKQSGLFPNQTYTRALVHWDRAADQGYSTARLKLGDYHYYGKGTEVDYEIAASHYKVAVEQSNNAQAMFNIGYMHEQGLGMKRDIHLAKRHYDMAAEASSDAVAPVTLALIKLAFLFALEFLETKQWFHSSQWPSLSHYLSEDWDLYLMTFLALVLGFVVAYRRQRR